ncbi:LacI family DNA-binding transcriptional regulator [Clostridium minihomine]|uniref:LacI family DNA-binding transcriptional regulator n=1 Tax=Clostridium minihomine TaxID=2045012 RepID=UPI000C75CF6B|nr:LacI family DNA-binding transcriptional regulator [Clostridium minihomine]
MTIKDIARESGFAVSTVSRALNNHPDVSEETKRKIQEVVAAHSFVPNQNARQLKRTATNSIAVLVKGISNMLFAPILEQTQVLIEKAGYTAQVCYLDEDDNEVRQAHQLIRESKPLGLLFLGGNLLNFQQAFAQIPIPAVLVAASAAGLNFPNLSSVSTDDTAASARAIQHLVEKGHRNIGVIGGNRHDTSSISYLRYLGCQKTFEQYRIEFHEEQYQKARFSYESGYHAMKRLLQSSPKVTAVFAMSDVMAIGACRLLLDQGIQIPRDISVMGFDGIELAEYYNPKLSTIAQSKSQMAEQGVSILLDCIEKQAPAVHQVVDFQMREGESVCRLRPQPAFASESTQYDSGGIGR